MAVMIRILLAEDDTSMREYLQRALSRVGYEVEAVGCGTEAMPLLEAGRFDLLLTDIVMPEMDGIELAQKASVIDPAIRVMFITGFAAVGCGTEAMPLLEAERFDLLLTDIVMPEMDGIELAQKASVIDPAIRVMFITGFAAVALQGGRTAPEAKLLSKPFHLKDLVAEVDRIFQSEDQHGRL